MAIECQKCHFDNPSDSKFCKECGTQLLLTEEISAPTKTLQVPLKELKTGAIFAGRYEILEELGKGGMGRVYKALDKEIDEEVAVKLLKPEIAEDEKIIERFRNELKFARKIAHKNVCKMYHLAKEEDSPYITMEYVSGENLKSLVRRKEKIAEDEAISLAKQVCEGLAEAHRLGVVHRDLKPQNVMIDKEGLAKVMDFGIARSVEAPGVTATGVMIGTPDYISPEQAEGEEADERSDIYSLGVILYEMVTGQVPFKGDTALSVALKHKAQLPQDPRKLNPEISEDLGRLILICMEKDRERRYQRSDELLADLRNIEEGLPHGTKLRPRRKPFAAALIRKKLFIPALVVALVVIGIAIWQVLRTKEVIPIPSVAIMYFKNNTGDQSLDHWRTALSDLMITDLSQSKYLNILPGDRLFKILNQLNQLEAKSYSSDILKQVASRGKVNHIVTGDYVKAGDIFRINVMLQEAETGELIGSQRVEGKGEESIFSMVDDLTRRIKANFKLSPEQIAGDIDKEVGKITTSSPEAYKYWTEGLKYKDEGDWRQSIQFLERAVAIDPEFAMAFMYMAANYINLGYLSRANTYFQKALELSDRVSDRERLKIQGVFFKESEKRIDKAIEAYNQLLQLYPDDWIGNNVLGVWYFILEEWDKGKERFEVNIQNKVEKVPSYVNMARVYMAKGLYDRAREVLESYINNFSDNAAIRSMLAFNYLCQGRYDLGLIEVDKAFSLNPALFENLRVKGDIYLCKGHLILAEKEYKKLLDTENPGANLLWGRRKLGAFYLLQGKFEKSKDQSIQGIELSKKQGEKESESFFHMQLAYSNLKSRNLEEALKECQKGWRSAIEDKSQFYQNRILYMKGLIYLGMESMDEAQKIAGELNELIVKGFNKKEIRYYNNLMGMIELERKNFSQAIEYFKKALSLLPYQFGPWDPHNEHALFIDPLALAYYKAGEIEKAREEYERITSLTAGRLNYGDIFAKSFYMLGKIYEKQDNRAKAIKQYEKFLELWKDADPGFDEVEGAKKRLAELKSQ